MNELFEKRIRTYFDEDADALIESISRPCTQGFFLNTKKANKDKIFSLIDFPYEESPFTDESFYHYEDNIGKTIAYECGLIYPQEIAASLTSRFIDTDNIHLVVDLCAAPGGKTINVLNRLSSEILCISNDISHNRAQVLSSNLERLGLDNAIITNKNCEDLSYQLEGKADLVILDAPCSGEGMVRKYPEIMDNYSENNILSLAKTQSELLEDAYRILRKGGQLLYSTCTFAYEEDEDQIIDFLNRHEDMKLVEIEMDSHSKLKGTVKLSFLENTEGQFFAMMRKEGDEAISKLKELKTVKDPLVDSFIRDNLAIDEYYLYKNKDRFYLSLRPLPDLKNNVLKYGIYIGETIKNRFEPSHNLYRANSLIGKYKYVYDMNDKEYMDFISGKELKTSAGNHYYLLTYHDVSVGFGKSGNGTIKNKYPKGLRRVL